MLIKSTEYSNPQPRIKRATACVRIVTTLYQLQAEIQSNRATVQIEKEPQASVAPQELNL